MTPVAATDPWDEERARRWLAASGDRERQLAPVSDALFAHVDLRPGEQVLDVGCGTGPTTVRAAQLVGTDSEPAGRAVGTDLSPTLIAHARTRPQPAGIEWLTADAQTHDFGTAAYDAVVSRFGVMFFPDAAAAFANLARACRAGGRLACAVWRRRDDCPLFGIPYAVVVATLERLGATGSEDDGNGGMFSLADASTVPDLLGRAGWEDVRLVADDRPLYLGGPGDAAHVAQSALEVGPVRVLLEEQPTTVVDEVRRRLVGWAEERHDGSGVPLPGGFAVLQARRAA